MIQWRIAPHMARKGWTNARQLALGAGITYPVAWAIVLGGPVGRLDTGTLDKLTVAFGLSEPWDLLEYVPD